MNDPQKPDPIDTALCDYLQRIDRGEPVAPEVFLAA